MSGCMNEWLLPDVPLHQDSARLVVPGCCALWVESQRLVEAGDSLLPLPQVGEPLRLILPLCCVLRQGLGHGSLWARLRWRRRVVFLALPKISSKWRRKSLTMRSLPNVVPRHHRMQKTANALSCCGLDFTPGCGRCPSQEFDKQITRLKGKIEHRAASFRRVGQVTEVGQACSRSLVPYGSGRRADPSACAGDRPGSPIPRRSPEAYHRRPTHAPAILSS